MADTVLTELKIHEFDSVEQMSQYESEIGENDIVYTPDVSVRLPILTPMWFDHQVNDESWLNADTFSWQPSAKYKQTYEHLVNDINGKTLQSEVVGDITIQFYLADDGHKICPASEESNLVTLYESTGVAWYYLLDQTNQQFKLPRTNWGFTGLRDSVGKMAYTGTSGATPDYSSGVTISSGWVAEYDCVGYCDVKQDNKVSGVVYVDGKAVYNYAGGDYPKRNGSQWFVPKGSTVTYSGTWTVTPTVYPLKTVYDKTPATQMRLYFWVGTFDQTATEQTAGLNAEMFNGKADCNLLNTTDNVDIVIESQLPTGDNGYTWYRKYKSGWVEQGGDGISVVEIGSKTVTLPVPMADTRYVALVADNSYNVSSASEINVGIQKYSTTQVRIFTQYILPNTISTSWFVCGMAA